jgi:hypothetical protein
MHIDAKLTLAKGHIMGLLPRWRFMTWLILGYRRRFGGLDGDSYKDVPYVQAQCASLARQLAELS